MRTVVRMRRLSRRWRHLCESLQFICLSSEDFESWSNVKFTRFLNNLFLLRAKVNLHTFQLHWCCTRSLECSDVMMWIAYAVKHNVKVLDVEVAGYDRPFLPHCIFTCPSLQELNLQLEGVSDELILLMLPVTINFPSLRKLRLADVEMSQVSLDRIIAQSPVLEDLELKNCAKYFTLIDSKVLKRLAFDGFEDCPCRDRLTIAAPQLIHFKCIGCPLENISWRGQPSLESAHIETSGHTFDGEYGFTGIISHAKRLELLTFNGTDVKFPKAGKRAGANAMLSTEMALQCPHLQEVIIHCSKGDEGIDTMVNAMVANGVSLEKIQITFYEDIVEKCRSEVARKTQERRKQFSIFEKTLKENPEWVDNSSYAGSDSDNSNDDDGDNDDESGADDEDEDAESGDENGDDDAMEDEDDDDEMGDEDDDDDDEMEDEDDSDDDMEEDGVNEHDNDDDR
ncbi:hypothetical protein EJB05_16699 [Eragrostis curvula]|uniref:F-box/LRR-repeat protein 15/At3g58940/PEG3-like LRR domain-containing protein n=1 Tax=Eragrostis curvula TaxID=38414 RepID=A0A5J9VFV8_9POAL|nr:hypothetical protein EJB05_16699 [Eragrostis curvula]